MTQESLQKRLAELETQSKALIKQIDDQTLNVQTLREEALIVKGAYQETEKLIAELSKPEGLEGIIEEPVKEETPDA